MTTDPHTLDSTHQAVGQHALWEEVLRLRALLRTGLALADELSPLALLAAYPPLYTRTHAWRTAVRSELGA